MFSVIKNSDITSAYVAEIVVDTRADIDDLPKEKFAVGTDVICLEDTSVWMLGNDNEWHEL